MINLPWQLFPIDGSFDEQQLTALLVLFVARLMIVVGHAPRVANRFDMKLR